MKKVFTSAVVFLAGLLLAIIGLIGWILPVLPGLPLFIFGLFLMMSAHPKGRIKAREWKAWYLSRRWTKKPADPSDDQKS